MAKLYLVATPIGNLEDVSLRALRILKEVKVVFTEKPKTTKKLFEKYSINTPVQSFHEHSSLSVFNIVVAKLKQNKDIALVTEAGTPGISDPGGTAWLPEGSRDCHCAGRTGPFAAQIQENTIPANSRPLNFQRK